LPVLGRLCGASTDAPAGKSVADARWTWLAGRKAQRRLWETKTGESDEKVPRKWVDQLLGQLQVERQQWPSSVVAGCLLVQQDQLEEEAAAAAGDTVAVLIDDVVVQLFDQLADRFRGYLQRRGHGSAAERGRGKGLHRRAAQRQPVRRGATSRASPALPASGRAPRPPSR
jgi:hypothetical protein